MKKFLKFFLICFFPLFAASAEPEIHRHGSGRVKREPTEVLVRFKKNVNRHNVPELVDGEDAGEISQIGVKRIRVKNPRALARMLKNNPNIEYIEPDEEMEFFAVPNDPNWNSQSSVLNAINAPAGWDISTGANGPIIAGVDSGVVLGHNDLPQLLPGFSAVPELSPNSDTVGHGTGVAGTIGMTGNNRVGGVGINWNAKIMPVKIDDASGSITVSNGAKGIIWAADNGAGVISCSWGHLLDLATLRNAVNYAYDKNVAIFAATGNDGSNTIAYPARYPNVMAVGGSSNGTTRVASSQYGPGMGVVSMNSYHTTTRTGGYSTMTGTSFSTPQVAGLAALILSMKPNAKPAQVYDFIQRGAKPLGGGYNEQTGYGLIDIGKTLKLVRDDAPKMCRCACKGEEWPPKD
ncbi:MAG: S8 family serine peptidase [Alphaproteobacteria bacterium]|nr:S8 family serine peptidase [Alphaproteobacteria bacterium]